MQWILRKWTKTVKFREKNIFRGKLFFDKRWGREIKIYRTKRGIVSPLNFNCKTVTLIKKKFSPNI